MKTTINDSFLSWLTQKIFKKLKLSYFYHSHKIVDGLEVSALYALQILSSQNKK